MGMAGARTRPPPARCLHRSVPSSTPGRIMSQARDYLSKPPSRLPLCFRTYLDAAKKSIATFLVLLRHTLSAYGTAPSPEQDITTNSTKGTIRPKLLQRSEQRSDTRRVGKECVRQCRAWRSPT